MVRIINCRLVNNQLVSILIKNKKFSKIINQSNKLLRLDNALPLERLTDIALFGQETLIDAANNLILPGMIDSHVHSRQPGLAHKEDWQTLCKAAYKGGVVGVCDMPNTIPATVSRDAVVLKADLAAQSGLDFRLFLGIDSVNPDNTTQLLRDKTLPICGLKIFYGKTTGNQIFSDLALLEKYLARVPDVLIAFHAEDQATINLNRAKFDLGKLPLNYSDFSVHSQIRSPDSAISATEAILAWAKKARIPIHFTHISTPKEVKLIANASQEGLAVSMEIAPHHLIFTTEDYKRLGPFIKVNPAIRDPEIVTGLCGLFGQGFFQTYATDHAPHSFGEKDCVNYDNCPSGIPSIEFFLPLLLTLAKQNGLPLEQAVDLASLRPSKYFGFDIGSIKEGYAANFVWVVKKEYKLSSTQIVSKAGWTPYQGLPLSYYVKGTWHNGVRVYYSDGL